ncbi:GAF domain-containing protein [Bradyrhizobium sp. PMVTL-01]|uniref:GAF domain-containing protein n=1 Tax=Bradyrhizobium sp. PMVTL-01 TaxID=3434999 RepID=UPI003F6FC801
MARSARAGGKRVSAAKKRNQNVRNPPKTKRPFRRTTPAIPPEDTELREAREQQAATAEILRVIANSPSDVQRVFDAIASNAKSLIGGYSAAVHRVIDDVIHMVAFTPVSHEADEALRAAFPLPLSQWPLIASMQGGEAVQIADAETADPQNQRLGRARGWRSVLLMPLMSQGKFIGFIACTRREPGAFSPHHIQLLQTFADQAVIAVENARLFNETKEALERQTATSDILKVIASSPSDVQPVFEAIVNSAARLFEPCSATITLRQKDELHWGATAASITGFDVDHARSIYPIPFDPDRAPSAKAILERRMIEIPDTAAPGTPEIARSAAVAAGFRSITYVPLISRDRGIGTIILTHPQPGRWLSEKQLSLVQTFADQAVIAIENVRLFEQVQARTRDLAESLQQQTATADVLKVISRSAFDLQTVLDKLVESATHLCEADHAWLFQRDGELLRFSSSYGHGTAQHERIKEFFRSREVRIERGSIVGRSASEGRVVHVADVLNDPEYTWNEAQKIGGYRAALGAPLLRDGSVVGVIFVAKTKPEPYSRKQIELVTTFADQAVIAIENARLFNEVQAKTRDLEETLRQQTATAEVLKVISRSTVDIQPVFDVIAENAVNLCEAERAFIFRYDGQVLRAVAHCNAGPEVQKFVYGNPIAPGKQSISARAALERRTIHIADIQADPDYAYALKDTRPIRTLLSVPMLKGEELVGVITSYRLEIKPFSEEQIRLMEAFASQAVIAIENVRLFNETKEALERQTATTEVLEVINSSPGNLAPVFDEMLEKAIRLCDAVSGHFRTYDGNSFPLAAVRGDVKHVEAMQQRGPLVPGPYHPISRFLRGANLIHLPNTRESEEYGADARFRNLVDLGVLSLLSVALRKDGALLGYINVYRHVAQPFTERQIALLQNFASQAVIAMENARLITQTREALEQQTATADVLKVISRSSIDLGTVLDTLVQTVARLCRADQTYLFRRHPDGLHHLIASHGLSKEAKAYVETHPFAPDHGTTSGRVALERRAIHIPDVLADPDYTYREGQLLTGMRTGLGLPLLRENALIGVFVIARTRVDPFVDKEIELATTFSDQAVIAIENARLFEELRERQAELRVTFDNMGDGVVMFDAEARLAAWNRNFQEMLDLPDAFLAERPSYADYFRYLAKRGEYSADLEEQLIGTVEDTRRELRLERTRPDGRVVEVRRNAVPDGGFVLIYADITKRKRAEEAIRLARDAAEKALRDLQTAQDRLIQTEKLASLGQLTAGIAHEIKNPLNFVNNFSALSVELTDDLNDVLRQAELAGTLRTEVDELTGLLKSNLEKVVQHGKRADSIVKNMLLHSREGSGELQAADINALVEESLNLAYHGARAEKADFTITLKHDLDPDAGALDVYPQEITRALLNLISNGFYAATKRKGQNGEVGFEPTLMATTKDVGASVEIRIRDNGTGIPSEVKSKIFNPFFTTKPAGEGTGLGLSMTHDIIVKQHGGTIKVDTEPGVFTEFIITLPRITGVQNSYRSTT